MATIAGSVSVEALEPFANQPFTDFTREENIRAQEEALRQVESELGRSYPLIINGERRMTADTFTSNNPAHPDQVLAIFAKAGVAEVNEAVEAAWKRFQTWQYAPAEERAGYLLKAAQLMRERRFYFNAIMIYEVGKSWPEADGDTAEAIDFMEFYAREALRLAGKQPLHQYPGGRERPGLYSARRWRCYSAVELPLRDHGWSDHFGAGDGQHRDSEARQHCGADCRALCRSAGGGGRAAGRRQLPAGARWRDWRRAGATSTDALRLVHRLARGGAAHQSVGGEPAEGQIWIKRAMLEMGGKDGIVVDETADLDAAATAIVASAFGFQGQKCSACSRAILVEAVYDAVVARSSRRRSK